MCGVITNCGRCAVRADSVHVRHAFVEVNVVIGVVLGELLVGVRVVPIVVCDDAVVRRTLVLIAFHRSHCFHVAILRRISQYWRYSVYPPPVGDSKLLLTVTEF